MWDCYLPALENSKDKSLTLVAGIHCRKASDTRSSWVSVYFSPSLPLRSSSSTSTSDQRETLRVNTSSKRLKSVYDFYVAPVASQFSNSSIRLYVLYSTAGRMIKTGLTASVIVSQWTWAATLLQSSNVAWQYGVSGPFW